MTRAMPAIALSGTRLFRDREGDRETARDGLHRARAALGRAERELGELEQVAAQVAGPFELSRARSLWKRLEVAGGTETCCRPGLFSRLRASRAQVESAEAGLRAAEAELFSSLRRR